MIILGIDPGSRKAGYGVIELVGRKVKYIDSGVMAFDHIDEFMHRLGEIHQQCTEIVDLHSPAEIAIESLIYVKSVSSYGKLAQARGAMIAAFMKGHLGHVFEYAPNLVKSSVTGHGHASKDGIKKGVEMILGKREFKSADESDALAIAICHAFNGKMKSPGTGSGISYSRGRTLKQVFKNKVK